MSDPDPSPSKRLALTPRQRRLRVITLVLLIWIAAMIAFGALHPFFHIVHPLVLTPRLRRAIAVKGVLILGYWTLCFMLTLSLLLVAWLDVREVRRSVLREQRDMWQEIAEQARRQRGRPSDP